MSIDELLKPRVICIGAEKRHYPHSPFEIGDILTKDERNVFCKTPLLFEPSPEYYPHLFKPLQWWEHREEKDMPEYVKYNNGLEVFKRVFAVAGSNQVMVELPKGKYGDATVGPVGLRNLLPATEEEYIQFKKINP